MSDDLLDCRAVFEAIPEPIVVLLPDAPRFTIVGATAASLAAFDVNRENTLGKSAFELLARNDDADALRASLERVIATRAIDTMPVRSFEVRSPGRAARTRHVRAHNVPVCAPSGELRYVLHRVEDVTALYDAQAGHEAAARELDAFAYSVSHDLRAPLRAIDGFSRALAEEYADVVGERGKDYVQRVSGAVTRLGSLIDSLLALSRIGRAALAKEPVDLTALARDVNHELARANPARNVAIEIGDGLRATGDRALVRTLLLHLLGNAWKFTAPRERARIEVGATARPEPAFFVRDNGAGFAMRYASRLFAPFQRLHSPREFDGVGMGLALAQRIVARHGGRIWAEAEVDEGAAFFFTLPD